MKKAMLVIMVLLVLVGCSNNNPNETEKQPEKTQAEIEKEELCSELFGDKENKITTSYFNNEKGIRRFVINFNNKYENKITKVDWTKNHSIAYLYCNDKRFEFNDNDDGAIITIDFGEGKAMLPEYKKIMLDLSKYIDETINDEIFNNAFEEAEKSRETVNITDKVNIEVHYRAEAISFMPADSYTIKIVEIK